MVSSFARLDTALDAGTHMLLAEQGPSGLRNARDLCDRFHLLDTANGHLRDPEGAGDVSPLAPCPGRLHGAALVRTQLARRLDSQDAGATQSGPAWDGGDAVAGMVHANFALVAENHLV